MAKICPSCGYRTADDNAVYCNKCGYPFPQYQQPAQPAPVRPAPVAAAPPPPRPRRAPRRPARKKPRRGGFPGFDRTISEDNLRLVYMAGAAAIVLMAIIGITGGYVPKGAVPENASFTNTTALTHDPAGSPIFWILFLIVANVLWRIACEACAALFRLNDALKGETSGEEDGETEYAGEEAPGYGAGMEGQMVQCPHCGKIVPSEDIRECEHCGVQGCSNCIRKMGLVKKTMTCRDCYEGG